jgi:molybdopterin-containing oxidoreductase family membrane subunit
VRDRAKTKLRKHLYGVASFGWSGSTKHWQRHESLSLVLAGLSTPLVLSVHTIVSFDFATSVVPGWHTTIFPPYFVAGAIFSGFAMVQTLMLILRKVMNLQDYITLGHIEAMNKVIVLTGSIVGCAYLTELFMAWYSQNPYEQDIFFKYFTNVGDGLFAVFILLILLFLVKIRTFFIGLSTFLLSLELTLQFASTNKDNNTPKNTITFFISF